MNNLLLGVALFLLLPFTQENPCEYKGVISSAVLDKNGLFKDSSFELGQFCLYFDILNCRREGAEIYLEGATTYPRGLHGRMMNEEDSVELLLCQQVNRRRLKVIDTLAVSDKNGAFKVHFISRQDYHLILHKKGLNSPVPVFDVKDFKD